MGKQETYEKGAFVLGSDYIHHINEHPDFKETTLTDNESWELSDLMQSAYTLKKTAELFQLLGGALFISLGYAVSGFARSEESAAPIANLVALPMMFLSGVFFSRDNLPSVLETITEYFPLTFLANGMREVTAEGAGLLDVSGDLLGLAAWTVAFFVLAVKAFRWE